MKKSRFISLILVVVLASIALVGCVVKLDGNPRLSELRDNIFIAENEQYKIVAVTGTRENAFSIDGISQKEKRGFTIFTVTPQDLGAEFTYKTTINGTEYSGKLVRHPYNQTYSCEIPDRVSQNQVEFTINGGGEAALTAVSVKGENCIDGQKAYSTAYNRLKKEIDIKAKEFDYEIFVRFIDNPINSGGGYFWYVAFIFTDKTVLAALIDPITVEIAALKD